MQKVRVFKLASEFGMENSEMVSKINEFGFPVKNYMSSISADDAMQVREKMKREKESSTIEEHIRPTVVRRRTRKKPKIRAVPDTAASPAAAAPTAKAKGESSKEKSASKLESERLWESMTSAPKPAVIEDAVPVAAPVETQVETPTPAPVEVQEEPTAPEKEVEPVVEEPAAPAASEERVSIAPGALRPAHEAPIIKRKIKKPKKGEDVQESTPATSRRRKVESREMKPQRAAQAQAATPMGRKRRMAPGKKGQKTEITTPKAIKRVVKIEGETTLQDLAKKMAVKSTELLMKLMGMGMTNININSSLDLDTSKIIAEEFGYQIENIAIDEEDLLAETRGEESKEEIANRQTRNPIVTMMGHVDHGKTSLLDYIRKANVVDGEAGGITQHIGAYRAKTDIGEITFIDTPGHAAFSAMRARGATTTDIVIIVCAADDGVMPQTVEAIEHAKAAECPLIVAINKCDLPSADPEKAKRDLLEHGLVPEALGGETIVVEVSAKTGKGIDQLMEMVSLQAEIMELNANPKRPAMGVILEAYLDKGRGPVSHVLVQDGTLDKNDIVVAGTAFGKIRTMTDEHGNQLEQAGPSTPVELLGLSDVPAAGDTFDVAKDMRTAEKVATTRQQREKSSLIASARPSLDALLDQLGSAEQSELKVVIKADVRGTMEAIKESLENLSVEKVKVTVVAASVGGITESDVLLASTANALIIGFNVRPAGKAKSLAKEQNIEIKIFSIIYEIIDTIKAAMKGLLQPEIEHNEIGQAEVRDVFRIPKIGAIAGCYVTTGKVARSGFAKLIRDSVQIWEGEVSSLRRFKDDAKEVAAGYECGIGLEGFNDIKPGDVIEFYVKEEVEATLE